MSAWIAIASMSAGVCLTILNLVFYFLTVAKQKKEVAKLDLEIEMQKAQRIGLHPRYSVFYVEVHDEGWYDLENEVGTRGGFWRFPMLRNDVFASMEFGGTQSASSLRCDDLQIDQKLQTSAYEKNVDTAVFLVVEQTGKAKACDVRLVVKTLTLTTGRCMEVFEADDLNRWAEKTDHPWGRMVPGEIKLGDLDTGQGVLIPLLVRTHLWRREPVDWFSITQGPVVIPLHLTYIDEVDRERREYPVREMLEVPQQLSARVVVRG
jgi:hypothetical protein